MMFGIFNRIRPTGIAPVVSYPGRNLEDDDELPHVERLQAVDIRPGDTIIATLDPNVATPDAIQLVKDALEDEFPRNAVVVIAGVQLAVGRPHP